MIAQKHLLYILVLSVCAFLFSCSNVDDVTSPSGDAVKATFSLSTRASVGTPHDPIDNSELINDYYVVFADRSGTIVEIFNKDCSPVEIDEFTLELAPGIYRVYAFANIPQSYIATLGLTKGSKIAGFPKAFEKVYYPIPGFFNTTTLLPTDAYGANIPMTSIEAQEITVTERATQTFGIEVRRLFAKLQFNYTNPTDEDLELRSQSVSNLTLNATADKGAVRLMNYDDALVLLSPEARTATLSHNYTTPLLLEKNGGTATKSFYVLESKANNITNSFMMDFDVVRKGESPSEARDYMRYALTDPNTLTAIRRNDWIVIPITLAEWQMRLEARTYPPIGGYPEAEISESESNEFIVVFQGGGDFVIRPFIRKTTDGDNWFGIDNTLKIHGTPTIIVRDTDGIFNTQPTLTKTGEIIGNMKVASFKKASIEISVDVITSAPGVTPMTTKNLKRKIFVTQK